MEGLTRGQFKDAGSDSSILGPDSGSNKDWGTGNDSGTTQDAGSDTGTTTTTAFTGAGAYASNKPATTAVQYHMNNGVGVTPGLGVDCLSCHKMGGSGTQFMFAGTVFQDKAGTMPAADVEVRLLDNNNVGYSTHSDDDGNFWLKSTTTPAYPAMTGARTSTQTALMNGNITLSSCNSCHDKNTTDPVHVP